MDGSIRTRKVTAQQVADRAGVSISAVSRAFTEGASISAGTHRKVMTAAHALGYQPNIMARSLMTGRTGLIGLVSNNFDNPAFMEIFDLFTRLLQSQGLKPLLANLSGNSDVEQAVAMLRQYNVDAVIVASSTLSPAFVTGCLTAGIPIVHAFGKAQGGEALHVVRADNAGGGRLAAQTLLQHGYRSMAFLGGPRSASSTADRLLGFRAGMKTAGLVPVAEVFAKSYSHDEGRRVMHEMLTQPGVQAVFCGDDILAIGALDACKERGTSVPGDIGILGFNDIAMAAWPAFNLSTVRQPISDIISAAVDQAIRLVANQPIALEAKTFPCDVVLRRTLRNI